MNQCKVVSAVLFVVTTVYTVSGTTDPCQDYKIINQVRRSSAALRENPDLDVWDVYLETGWYRFTSYTGGEIPTSCVQPNHCSAQVPVWMNGTLPDSNDIVSRTACGNYGIPWDCCPVKINIRVKRCNDSTPEMFYYVYELRSTPYSHMTYCAGNSPLCPDGEVYDTYYQRCIVTRHIVPCDFEGHGLCEWRQNRDDDMNWAKTTGSHSAKTILPHTDQTTKTGEGNYIFLITSQNNQPAGKASLISPVVVPSRTDICNMSFYHHVVESGTLSIYVHGYFSNRSSLIWSSTDGRIQQRTNSWTKEVVSLVDVNPFQIKIEGTIGERENSAVSLDDISFSSGCIKDVDGAVRLVDSTSFGEGRVEIYHDHKWGTICNRSWTQSEGDVICSQLGYTRALPSSRHYPAPSTTPIHLDEVSCRSANVTKISYCIHSRWGHHHPYCNHDMDVSVACTGDWYKCNDTAFNCSNKICVSPEVLCDFTNDCGDHSDEQDCTYPGRCGFQNTLCDWDQDKSDDADWILTDGASNNFTNAPHMDHRTNPAGKFLLLNSSSAQTAKISLPQHYLSTGQNCKFLFHYFITTNTGQLTLRISSNTNQPSKETFTTTPERQWLRKVVPIPVGSMFQITLEGHIWPAGIGVIAIDDVSLTPDCVRINGSKATSTPLYSSKTMDDLFSTTRTTTKKAFDDSKSRRQEGPAVPTSAIVVPSVAIPGAIATFFVFKFHRKMRQKRSVAESRAAVYMHDLESRRGHDEPREESEYENISNPTWAQVQSAQSSDTTAATGGKIVSQPESLDGAKETSNPQKHIHLENIPYAGKTVTDELSVNIDTDGYASLLKNAVEPLYTSPFATSLEDGAAAQSSDTTAATGGKIVSQPESLDGAKETSNPQKHIPLENIPYDGKTVTDDLSVSIDTDGYASLLKNVVEPVYTSPFATSVEDDAADLKCYLSQNGFAEFTDMFMGKGLTLSFLRTATEGDLINFGIPIAIAVAVVKKTHEIPIKDNEYTSLQIDASGYSSPDFRTSTPVAEVNI